jgi:serine/threonine-protein kinase
MAALVAGLVIAGVGAVWLRTWSLAGPALDQAVLRARDLVDEAVAARLDRLDLVTRLLAADAPFRAYVAEGDRPSIRDLLSDRMTLYGCDAFVITDERGAPIADVWRSRGAAADPSGQPIIAAALARQSARGIWVEPDGRILLAAAEPLDAGSAAVLVTLEALDDARALALRRTTGADLIFFSRPDPGSAPIAGAATLASSRAHLADLLRAPALGLAHGSDGASPPPRIDIDGEAHVAVVAPLDAAAPDGRAGFVVLRSVDREIAWFRKIQGALVLVGLAAIPVALALGLLLGRHITRPIGTLVQAMERARAGDYDAPLPPEGNDEVGVLAGAFRSMLTRLKHREETDAWIGKIAARASAGQQLKAGRGDGAEPLEAGPGRGPAPFAPGGITATLPPAAIAPGALLQGRFRLLAPIGAGGMGTVWKARDESLREIVAIKILAADGLRTRPEHLERIRQEILLARRISHRNVLRTHELLALGSAWGILMEHVEGASLHSVLAEGRLPFSAGVRVVRQIMDGLQAAHAEGVVHRDLKPSNVLVDASGLVKIADFGLARPTGEGAGDALTLAGSVVGTPLYMSPEQAAGRPADLRSDVYSAGVMFFEILCGRRPFDAAGPVAQLRDHLETPPPSPRSINPALGEGIETVLLRALAKNPAARFASARALAEAFDRAAVEAGVE